MAKKILISFVFILFLVIISGIKITSAQNFGSSLSDYKVAVDTYQKADNDYQLARSQYLSSQTLTAQQKAQSATYTFLKSRDDVVRTYLLMVKAKLNETSGISDNDKQGLYARIDDEVNWYINHRDKIPSAGSLDDLFSDSAKASDRYNKTTSTLIYVILTTIPDGQLVTFITRISDIIQRVSDKTSEIRKNQDKETTNIERWIIETQNRVDRAKDKENGIKVDISSLEKSKDLSGSFNTFLGRYDDANQYLKEANIYLKEIVKNIMTN